MINDTSLKVKEIGTVRQIWCVVSNCNKSKKYDFNENDIDTNNIVFKLNINHIELDNREKKFV